MGENSRLRFARVGGLSAVKYKPKAGSRFGVGGFHTPPVRNGIFAFTWPYIEPFLVGWKLREGEKMHLRQFDYEGEIYAHIKPKGLHRSPVGSWYLMETSDLRVALSEHRHQNRKTLQEQSAMYRPDGGAQAQPFLGDPLQFFTKDDLEVFIPASALGRIR
jgi:hypothetical protein